MAIPNEQRRNNTQARTATDNARASAKDDDIRDSVSSPEGTENWEEEQTGFPPYWSPQEGKQFRGLVIGKDDRDPEFVRYILRATMAIECANGPAEDAAIVDVAPGEFFTCSQYATLPLDRYIGFEVLVTAKNKRGIKNNRELWSFSLRVSPETKKLVQAKQDKLLKEAQDAGL